MSRTLPELLHKKIRVMLITPSQRIKTFLVDDLSNSQKRKFKIGTETSIFDKDCIIEDGKVRYLIYQEHNPYPLKFEKNGVKPKADTLTDLLKLNFLQAFLGETTTTILLFAILALQIINLVMGWLH